MSERSLSGCAAWEINCLNCENKGGRSYLTMARLGQVTLVACAPTAYRNRSYLTMARLGQVTLVACAPTAYRNNMPPSKKVVRPRATKAMP